MDKACINCNRTDQQIPLLSLTFKDSTVYLCPQCLPLLIHQPEKLASKLPGIETTPAAHED